MAPTIRQTAGSVSDSCEPTSGLATRRATTIAPSTIPAAHTPENRAATTAFAASTSVRFGVARNVVRTSPLRYSPVTVIDARIISTGTPNTATPIAAFSGGSGLKS